MLWCVASPVLAQIDERENAVLEQWLEERSLDSLLTEQLQSRLESTVDADQREKIAKRLAKLYGRKLLSVDNDAQELIKRTRDLIQLYPQFESGRLRVAMLHARYLESEKSFRDWIRDGAQKKTQSDLEKKLTELDRDLSLAIQALTNRSEELFAASQFDQERRALEVERRAVDAEALHCQFLAGWSRYFLALLRPDEQVTLLENAELSFREFLQLDRETMLSEFDSRWFDFSSAWHVRAIAGLAAVAIVRKDDSLVQHLYDLLKNNAVTREGREAAVRFRYLGHCYCEQFARAMDVLRDQDSIRLMSREGRIRLWLIVNETSRASGSDAFEKIALAGLARNMAGELLVREYENRVGESAEANSFESCWVAGYAEFWKSENGETEAADRAAIQLQKALQYSEADPNDAARCRYLQGWLMLKRGEFENAVGAFSMVTEQLSKVDPLLASESAWLAAKTSIQLGKQGATNLNEAWNRLERFVRKWPDSPHASKAEFEKLRIELKSMPAEDAIGRLKEIESGEDNFGSALFEISVQSFRLWEAEATNPESLNVLRNACRNVGESNAASPLQKTKSAFLLVNALLRNEDVPFTEIELLLKRGQNWLDRSDEAELAGVELLYYRLQLQQRKGDSKAALETATRIAEIGKQTRFEVPALIHMAKYHDSRLEGLSQASSSRLDPAIAVYQRLSQRFGTTPEQLNSSANARVAYSRLGELHQMAGQDAESEAIFKSLVDAFPGNANYLRWLAVTKAERDAEGALGIWRRLAAGSEAGSDLWYESKLELAKSIARDDKPSAAKLIRQTMQLGGELPSNWQEQYDSALKRYSGGSDLQ